jgi:hypothetical protein
MNIPSRCKERLPPIDTADTTAAPMQKTSLVAPTDSTNSLEPNTVAIGTTGLERNVNRNDSAPLMSPLDSLVARVRGEFREMPGLRLTFAQACRLWQVDAATCEVILQTLRAEGFLARTASGMFMALPTPTAAASLPITGGREPRATMSLQRRSA